MSDEIQLNGSGATSMIVADREGKVLIKFPNPVEWAAFEPNVALQVAHQMISAVQNCGMKVEIEVPRPKIPESMRSRMAARVKLILNNKREAAERNEVLCIRIVDTVLNMVGL